MAKARTNVRDRAINAYWKFLGLTPGSFPLHIAKSRSRATITIDGHKGGLSVTWSYSGGSLRRVAVGRNKIEG